jgi:hypothetical protein
MSRLTTIIFAFCMSIGSIGVRAVEIYTGEVEALQKVLWQKGVTDSTDDPKWRASLATALHRYCESVLAQVPRNTPEEDRWVDDEYRDLRNIPAASTPEPNPDNPLSFEHRFARIGNSVENARKTLRHLFSECSSISNKLTGTGQASRATEALWWVRLSRLFSAQQETERLAKIVGLLSKNVCRPFSPADFAEIADILKGRADVPPIDRNCLCSLDTIGYVIIDHAVIPLLEAS